jgi:hypothetical protein
MINLKKKSCIAKEEAPSFGISSCKVIQEMDVCPCNANVSQHVQYVYSGFAPDLKYRI